jgi:hypothetical protein
MSEKVFITKRQRARKKSAIPFTFKMVLALIALSLTAYMAFASFVDRRSASECVGGCEDAISLGTWILSFVIIFGVVIGAGALLGLIFALIKRARSKDDQGSYFASAMEQNQTRENKDDDE